MLTLIKTNDPQSFKAVGRTVDVSILSSFEGKKLWIKPIGLPHIESDEIDSISDPERIWWDNVRFKVEDISRHFYVFEIPDIYKPSSVVNKLRACL